MMSQVLLSPCEYFSGLSLYQLILTVPMLLIHGYS